MSKVIVANDKGGVGKSLVTQGLVLAAAEAGSKPVVIEVESTPRLGRVLGEVISIQPPTHDPDVLYRDPDTIFAVWDEMAAAVAAPSAIVDIGANLFRPFARWAAAGGARQLAGGDGLTVVAVMTMDQHALSAGLAALRETGAVLPAARRVAVLNPVIADFIDGDQKIAGLIKAAEAGGGAIDVIRLERMTAPAWGHLMNMGRLDAAITNPAVERELLTFLPAGKVARSLAVYQTWYAGLIKALSDLV